MIKLSISVFLSGPFGEYGMPTDAKA